MVVIKLELRKVINTTDLIIISECLLAVTGSFVVYRTNCSF
jgi:hypothetical protein